MTDFTDFWEKYEYELKKYFASKKQFCHWLGFHENNLPFPYKLEDVIEERLNTRKF